MSDQPGRPPGRPAAEEPGAGDRGRERAEPEQARREPAEPEPADEPTAGREGAAGAPDRQVAESARERLAQESRAGWTDTPPRDGALSGDWQGPISSSPWDRQREALVNEDAYLREHAWRRGGETLRWGDDASQLAERAVGAARDEYRYADALEMTREIGDDELRKRTVGQILLIKDGRRPLAGGVA